MSDLALASPLCEQPWTAGIPSQQGIEFLERASVNPLLPIAMGIEVLGRHPGGHLRIPTAATAPLAIGHWPLRRDPLHGWLWRLSDDDPGKSERCRPPPSWPPPRCPAPQPGA